MHSYVVPPLREALYSSIHFRCCKLVMYHIQKLNKPKFLTWGFVDLTEIFFRSSKSAICPSGSYHNIRNPRFYRRKAACKTKDGQNMDEVCTDGGNVLSSSHVACREAQDALFEYLHSTRSMQFMDAENISRNSPRFLRKLLKGVENKESVGQSVTRFLRYHPINEFEPFFESMGLEPSEYSSLLPRNLTFLSDDNVLLENYHVFCRYGFAPNKIGKIYKEAQEVFRYNDGVLLSRLKSLQDVVLDQYTVVKLVASSPSILIGDGTQDYVKVVEELKGVGIVSGWFFEHLSEENSYNWTHMLELWCLFRRLGFENEHLRGLLHKHPTLLLKSTITTSIIVFLIKFGASKNDILSLFLQFPKMEVHKCVSNLRRSYSFLSEIELDVHDIATLFCAYPTLLGSITLKSVKTALNCLNTGKKRLCAIIMNNPQGLRFLAIGAKVKKLPASKESTSDKIKFLMGMGFLENSNEMKRALKRFRGRAGELQERFNCLVNVGFDQKDVVEMLKIAPQVINQTKEVLEMKIDFFVNGLGCPLSSLAAYPSALSYSMEKVKLRFSMCNWLQEQGKTKPVALSTVLACSEKQFIKEKVIRHPKGIEVYETLKKQIYSDGII